MNKIISNLASSKDVSITSKFVYNNSIASSDFSAISGLLSATGISMLGAILISGGLGFAGSVDSDLISSDGDWSSANCRKVAIMGAVNVILGACSGAGSQNSEELGKRLLKNKEVYKTFSTLYKATNKYAAGTISKRGFIDNN